VPLKPLAYRVVKRKLEAAGFAEVDQRGSHVKFAKQYGSMKLVVIVPKHSQVAVGTLRSILRQASLSVDEFERL